LAELWDGTSWSIMATPKPPPVGDHVFGAVSCTSATAVHRGRPFRDQLQQPRDVGGALGRDQLVDPIHPQPPRRD
jgi:hypothetical protein